MNQKSIPAANKKPKSTFIEEARRKQILEVALQEIETRGYQNITVQKIADKARISKGVIYYHFNTTEELLGDIWAALIDELFEYRKERVESRKTARDKLRTYLEANFEFLTKNFNKFTALFRMGIEINSAETSINPWSRQTNERCFKYLSSILQAGQQNGEFRKFQTEIIAPIIQGAIDGLAIQWIASRELFSFEASIQILEEIIESYTKKDSGS